jgi:hypothetical protein
MDILLDSLTKSIKHLQAIDKAFSEGSYPEKDLYLQIKKNIKSLNKKSGFLFTDELYVGGKKAGKKGTGYGRQMILSDIITYIIAGRGYFYAIKSKESMQNFMEITLNVINQLMIFDSLTTNVELRNKVLNTLEKTIGNDFFKEKERSEENNALKAYHGAIGLPLQEFKPEKAVMDILSSDEDEGQKRLENWFDSILPKELGLWGELLVYIYLLRQKMGYVLPLLLTQYLISGYYDNVLKVPDFLIIPFNIQEKMIGIEVGGGKETQSTRFSNLTGITIATKANADNPKRCPICGKWILFCPMIIRRFCNQDFEILKMSEPVRCLAECDVFHDKSDITNGKCPFSSVRGVRPKNHVMKFEYSPATYHFHLQCALKDPEACEEIKENNILTYYPYIKGLEDLEGMLQEDKEYIINKLRKRVADLEKQLEKGQQKLTGY